MEERLKQIWDGFEQTTSRRLTGRGVDNIVVPHRADYRPDYQMDEALSAPEGFETPVEAAFAALHEELRRKERMFGGKKKKRAAPGAQDAPEDMAERRFNGDELIKGMKATALRTERPDRDYAAFLASDEGKAALKKHKKKRFGLF